MLNRNDIITLSGKTDFGKKFIEENGSQYEVVKFQTWGEHQILIRAKKENCEIGLLWINFLPTSKNFKIYKEDIRIN